jgi:C4-type Zn-finger protein
MPATRSTEYISFSYDPRSGPLGVDFIRQLEGYLRRLEERVETLQADNSALEARVKVLEEAP